MSRQIIVHVDGGLVQWVSSIETNDYTRLQSVLIVDTDIDQADPDDLTTAKNSHGEKLQAHVHEMKIDGDASNTDIGCLVLEYLKKE